MWEICISASEGRRDLNLGLKWPQYVSLYWHYEDAEAPCDYILEKKEKNWKTNKKTILEARFCRVSTSMSTILYTSYVVA